MECVCTTLTLFFLLGTHCCLCKQPKTTGCQTPGLKHDTHWHLDLEPMCRRACVIAYYTSEVLDSNAMQSSFVYSGRCLDALLIEANNACTQHQ